MLTLRTINNLILKEFCLTLIVSVLKLLYILLHYHLYYLDIFLFKLDVLIIIKMIGSTRSNL